ncbi:hypothetical protein QO003_002664 [Arthrobacter silviterrae]|uniref:Uncharacterized protein n=1 Tax=Arthrobacter silviterrae TaxID=2026658 RepID=A0ABX0D914_9MICC|nr:MULTISPECIES: hypothetical protein [Arthrobacter]MCU6480377.1 hypothetical protein [Arthrobacter sp. A2-55]MDQ0278361.1 hypothetical protein [Arthrobacter silviterrae]NGN82380.1 hypothetical protein [Arthrobacter silviterrae]
MAATAYGAGRDLDVGQALDGVGDGVGGEHVSAAPPGDLRVDFVAVGKHARQCEGAGVALDQVVVALDVDPGIAGVLARDALPVEEVPTNHAVVGAFLDVNRLCGNERPKVVVEHLDAVRAVHAVAAAKALPVGVGRANVDRLAVAGLHQPRVGDGGVLEDTVAGGIAEVHAFFLNAGHGNAVNRDEGGGVDDQAFLESLMVKPDSSQCGAWESHSP